VTAKEEQMEYGSTEVLVSGLGHPEGPYVLPDGRIVFANTYFSEIGVWEEGKGKSTFAHTGGGPNACMLGSDDFVYVTQTPNVGAWKAPEYRPPSIQRASMDGDVEIVATEIDGIRFNGPNDLTFGPDGRLYFTDSGDWEPETKPHPGYIFALDASGKGEVVEELGHVYPNGIVAEPDGSIVWVESYTLKVRRRRPDGSKEELHTLADGHIPDGLKVDANGDLWITTVSSGGVDVLGSDGTHKGFVATGGVPLNIVFGGTAVYITDMGVFDTTSADVPLNGNLLRVEVGVEGMPLFRGTVGIA
jgi:gluconolactonase